MINKNYLGVPISSLIQIIKRGYFTFCHGEVGVDDFMPYLKTLPEIDFVYCSLPKPEYFKYWYKMVNQAPQISYKKYMQLTVEIMLLLNAKEYHLEVNDGNKNLVFDAFKGLGFHHEVMPILYSAPLDSWSNRYARKRNWDEMVAFTLQEFKMPKVMYSHEYLDVVLERRSSSMNCFDPAIGKGLLVKMCLRHGHVSHGIDMNMDRLKVAIEMVEGGIGKISPK